MVRTACIPPVAGAIFGMTSGETQALANKMLDRAQALLLDRSLVEAFDAYNRAEQLGADPDECSGGRWQVHMLEGNMEAAWKESDSIRARGRLDPHRFWDGSSLTGKRVMVRCLHGLGDTIQMLRYLPDLLAVAASMVLEVPPRLFPLLTSLSFAKDERLAIVCWGQEAPPGSGVWETQIEVTELPYIFRTDRDDLPIRARYLDVPEAEVRRTKERMGPQHSARVGLVWTAGEWNQDRAIDPSRMRPLLRYPAEFWSLVQGDRAQRAGHAALGDRLEDAEIVGEGILPMAAVIANLDLVITTDTLAAHISGAIGTPVWVLLPHAADWRWMSDPERSPWYSSMRLFRQSSPGDWDGVLLRVESALEAVLVPACL